ncbi:hypothetical protein [uncultured Mediterranean phage uvMED]|nr:hypothetical protein [uncultured Mediterranean phage uvMED]BAR19683.1 hypothetical protein [uncultured Mediterranean phage uvMED]
MKITKRQEIWIEEFFNDMDGCEVRGRDRAQRLGRPEIRSKKHNILAIKWDGLENGFCLCHDGVRRQLYSWEIFSGECFH